MDTTNKKALLESFDHLMPCPNCQKYPSRQVRMKKDGVVEIKVAPWTKNELLNALFSRRYPGVITDYGLRNSIGYLYCSNCILTPEQITQVKQFFDEWI